MNKLLLLLTFFSLTTFAQFPGGGGPGGMGGRSDDLRTNRNQPQMPGMPTVELERGSNRISGSVIDSVSLKPVEYANLALFKKGDKTKPVDGAMSDDFGKFLIKGLPDGDYTLRISFIGYADKLIDVIKMGKGKREVVLDKITLSSSNKVLQEVTITGQKSLLEDKVDRLVYNADVDKTSQGGNATDVLQKVPMLSVDLDGNLSMRGNQNVKVLINNKPSTIMASSVADALKQIPADMIKTVEVITSPSAKYDAEGTAGIVNIITKKNNLQGLTGNVNTSAGTRGSNFFGGLNYKQGKLGLNMSGGANAFYNPGKAETIQETKNNSVVFKTNQSATSFLNGMFGRGQTGMSYDFDKYKSFNTSIQYGARAFNTTQDIASKTFRNGVQTDAFYRDIASKNQNQNVDWNMDYMRTFPTEQKEFSILSQVSRSYGNNSFAADIFNTDKIITNRQKNDNNSLTQEFTLQTDFQTPLPNKHLVEMGAKNIVRQIGSNYKYYLAGTNDNFVIDPRFPANEFNVNQDVASAYLSYSFTTKNKYSFKFGSRYEYTTNDASFTDGKKVNVADYGNLVPSMQLSKSLGAGKTIKLSYNRRIQRPSIRFMNPNVDSSNPQNISTGNPELLPELTNSFEFALSTFKKATSLNISLFGRFTTDAITQVRSVLETGAVFTKPQNIGFEQSFGTNIFTSFKPAAKWQMNLSSNTYYSMLENPTTKETNAGWVAEGNYFLSGTLKKGFAIQSFGFIRSPKIQLQGREGIFMMMNVGLRKDFTRKSGNKGSFGLSVDNPLTEYMKMTNEFTSATLYQRNDNYRYNRGVRLTFSYQFGKMTFGGTRRKSINNDDSKQEDSGNQGGQQPQGGGRPR